VTGVRKAARKRQRTTACRQEVPPTKKKRDDRPQGRGGLSERAGEVPRNTEKKPHTKDNAVGRGEARHKSQLQGRKGAIYTLHRKKNAGLVGRAWKKNNGGGGKEKEKKKMKIS